MYKRLLSLSKWLKKKSFFLFGARATGKTTWIQKNLPDHTKVYDLLHLKTYTRLLKNPHLLEEENKAGDLIVIDEVQKLPHLLNEVQRLIQKRGQRFLLTGSSARKLKKSNANLLAGRAWWASLFPLTFAEIPHFQLTRYLNRGGLPAIYKSSDYREDLEAYVYLYLKQEIQQEALARQVRAFAEFLDQMALCNGQEINYDRLASDLQVSPGTLKNYMEILNDTLLGFYLPAYVKTKKRKAISRSKYYMFDIGVTNILCHRGEIKTNSELFGKAFEHFIILEVRAFLSYFRKHARMTYWRSTARQEVDLIINNKVAIEIKSKTQVHDRDLKGLRALREEQMIHTYMVVSLDEEKRITRDKIYILPWRVFLNQLWKGQIKL